MRPVVLYTLLSLDGVAESPESFVVDWDDQLDANLAEVIGAQDAVLLGRQMYDEWSQYWPSSDQQPFASFINDVQKFVFTAHSVDQVWANTTVVARRSEDVVAELRRGDGAAIGIHGSIRLSQSLLRADLVDELRLVVFPTSLGTGRRLFEGTELQRWTLTESTPTSSGALLVSYRRSRN